MMKAVTVNSAMPAAGTTSGARQTALDLARRVLTIEADAVRALVDRVDTQFFEAVQMILGCRGRIIVSGIGKSGHIARKIASTMASTGTPAHFVHPAEASHGDLGMVLPMDVFLCVSNSGESDELLRIVPLVKRQGAQLIAMTGNSSSSLAREDTAVPAVPLEASLKEALLEMTRGGIGMTAVVDAKRTVAGVFTDGDLRRMLDRSIPNFDSVMIRDLMTPDPRVIHPDALAVEAVQLMESHKVNQMLVVDANGILVGALNMHDLFRAKVI